MQQKIAQLELEAKSSQQRILQAEREKQEIVEQAEREKQKIQREKKDIEGAYKGALELLENVKLSKEKGTDSSVEVPHGLFITLKV